MTLPVLHGLAPGAHDAGPKGLAAPRIDEIGLIDLARFLNHKFLGGALDLGLGDPAHGRRLWDGWRPFSGRGSMPRGWTRRSLRRRHWSLRARTRIAAKESAWDSAVTAELQVLRQRTQKESAIPRLHRR